MCATVVTFPNRRSERADTPVVPMPLHLRLLIIFTTRRANAVPTTHPAVQELIAVLKAEGWAVRGAEKRNYLLWRGGKTMRTSLQRVLILPVDRRNLSPRHFNVFVLGEICRAIARTSVDLQIEPDWRRRLELSATALLALPSPDALVLLESKHNSADARILFRSW